METCHHSEQMLIIVTGMEGQGKLALPANYLDL